MIVTVPGSFLAITTATFHLSNQRTRRRMDQSIRPSLTSIPGVGKSALTIQFIQSHVRAVSFLFIYHLGLVLVLVLSTPIRH